MRGINNCVLGGNAAADAQLRTVSGRDGNPIDLIEFTIYFNESTQKNSKSIPIKVTVWQNSPCWGAAPYVKKGSEVTVIGKLSANPYVSKTNGQPGAGLQLTATDIVLGRSPRDEYIQPTDDDDVPF